MKHIFEQTYDGYTLTGHAEVEAAESATSIGLGGDEHYDRLRADEQAAWSRDKDYVVAEQAHENQPKNDRRFELAKVAMGAMMSNKGVMNSCTRSELIKKAMGYADEMLSQLGE